ncbi:PHD finger protein 20-like protein 1 isoform X3 [Magallana gigas]|uniref:PHD finger protein 20-like protein 1 isoform X3 n=1 Tax=Magallana gigas TaxID=29159 RepID=UPI00333FB33E
MASKNKTDPVASNTSTDSESTNTSYEERAPHSTDSGGNEITADRSSELPYTSDCPGSSRLDADDISTCSSASSSTLAPIVSKRFPVRPGISWRKGERLEAMDFSSKWYSAKIVEIDEEERMVMIHFDGWNQRYDEWIEMDSEKLRPKTRHSTRKGRPKQSGYKVGDHVYAKWTDCKMYPGKVTAVNTDGSFDILFYDGFKKTVQGINIKTMPKDAQQQKIEIVHVLPKDERKRSMDDDIGEETALPNKRRSSSIYSRRERDSIDKASKVAESAGKVTERARSTSSDEGKRRRASNDRRRTKGSAKKLIVAGSLFKKRDRSTSSERSKAGSQSSKEPTSDSLTGSVEEQSTAKTGGLMEQPPSEIITQTETPSEEIAQVQAKEPVSDKKDPEAPSPTLASTTSVKTPDPTPSPGGASVPSGSVPVCMSAPGTPMTTPLSSMPPSPASTLSAVSSSPSTPKQSPGLKSDAPSSGPTLEPITPILPPKGKKEKKSRKQSFSPVGLSDAGENSARKRSKSTEKGAKSEQPQSSRKRSKSINEKVNYILVPETALPPKAFVIEPEHNHYKCTYENCNKAFRKESLLESHIKFYHSVEGKHPQNPPRKRRKTSSICSTDSDISVTTRQRYPSTSSLGRPATTVEGTTEVAITDLMEQEEQGLTDAAAYKLSDKSHTFGQEVTIAEESMEMEFEDTLSKDEVVNCICRFNEENGLMIQCDVCLCWQHAACFEITEDTLPKKYICFVCENPPGIRDSRRFMHDQDWLKLGHMAHFGFLPNQEEDEGCCRTVQATHGLVGDVHNVSAVLHGLKQQLQTARRKDQKDPMLQMWLQDLDNVNFDPVEHEDESEGEEMAIDRSNSIENSKQQENSDSEKKPEIETETEENKTEIDVGDSTDKNIITKSEEEQGTSTEIVKEGEPDKQEAEVGNVKEITDNSEKSTDVPNQENKSDQEHSDESVKNSKQLTVSRDNNLPSEQTEQNTSNTVTPKEGPEDNGVNRATSSGDNGGRARGPVDDGDHTVNNQTGKPGDQKDSMETEGLIGPDIDLPLEAALSSEVRVEDMSDLLDSVEVVKEDPFKHCERNLLEHILHVQTEIEQRLDHIEEQVSALESADTNFSPSGSSDRDLLSDVPNLKKTLYLLQHDLVRVQRMAAYHR